MALVEKYHVVAAERAVAVGESIKEGQVVSLNSAGEVVLQGNGNPIPYGIAGDTKSTSASAMPGIAAGWQNRVSDYFDETKASGAMTVYHSGGEFASDQFVAGVASAVPGDPLYAVDGMLADEPESDQDYIVGRVTEPVGLLPSGVPGVDINGDIALGSESNDTYVQFKLVI